MTVLQLAEYQPIVATKEGDGEDGNTVIDNRWKYTLFELIDQCNYLLNAIDADDDASERALIDTKDLLQELIAEDSYGLFNEE